MGVFIQAIVRPKKGRGLVSSSGVYYTSSLINKVIDVNKDSLIVKRQRESSYSVLSLDGSFSSGRDSVLSYLGDDVTPSGVMLYPRDFDSKERIVSYLDKYNVGKGLSDRIYYTDMARMISSLSSGIMSGITFVLVCFSSISLVVSSIMIGIITYISVLERTNEIGILRALGARKKDITRVFNAENFIIGVCSGVIGVVVAVFLNGIVNRIIYHFTELSGVASLSIVQAIVLVVISVFLTLLGGYIPAKGGSKKCPVAALRGN
jgi:putative ABC transport system permease protein